MNLFEYIENNTIRLEVSSRGGGIEIDISEFTGINGALLSAYQNYLGGGMLGRVCSDCNLDESQLTDEQQSDLNDLSEALKQYYHNQTNQYCDEWSESDYISNQTRPISGF